MPGVDVRSADQLGALVRWLVLSLGLLSAVRFMFGNPVAGEDYGITGNDFGGVPIAIADFYPFHMAP